MSNWNFYQVNINDEIASVYLDLDAKSDSENKEFNILFWLFIKLKVEKEDGLSHDDEFEKLNDYEEELIGNIDTSKSSYVGRITTGGMRQFYFYTDDINQLDKNVNITLAKHQDYLFQKGSKPDPEWNQYDTVIYPGKQGLEQIFAREVR